MSDARTSLLVYTHAWGIELTPTPARRYATLHNVNQRQCLAVTAASPSNRRATHLKKIWREVSRVHPVGTPTRRKLAKQASRIIRKIGVLIGTHLPIHDEMSHSFVSRLSHTAQEMKIFYHTSEVRVLMWFLLAPDPSPPARP